MLLGGDPDPDQPGHFYPTTLVADIDNDNPLVAEEQFGPALPIIRYSTVDEAIAMANGLDVGLGASVWSADAAEARKVAARIQAGTVWINKHGGVDPRSPSAEPSSPATASSSASRASKPSASRRSSTADAVLRRG